MWQKYSHIWCWHCIMWGCTIKCEKKNKGTTECDISTITYDVSTT